MPNACFANIRILETQTRYSKPSRTLPIFDEATSSLDAETTEHFAQTINQLRGKVGTIFIAHQLPKALVVDAVVQLGSCE
ncbi:MAG: hypothetical protein HYY77_13795 [Betaproteobacteria bacterium]|nr:hypothetical protein [Betaproteobacteria bacterium]